jgi:E3 Ubiquitin ligase
MTSLLHTLTSRSSLPWWGPVLGAGLGVHLFYRGFRLLARKRLIMNTPTSKIRSAAMGLVEVSGLAAGPFTITAPLTGRPCYYYRTLAWQWKREGKNRRWVKVAEESFHLPFYLEDNTGHVLVNPQGAEIEMHCDFQDEFGASLFSSSLEIPANVISFCVRNGVPTDAKIKLEEYSIKPKNALFVLGTLAHNPGVSVAATPVRSVAVEPQALALRLPVLKTSIGLGASLNRGPEVLPDDFAAPTMSCSRAVAGQPLDPAQPAKISTVLTKAGITQPAAWAAAGVSPAPVTGMANGQAAAPAPHREQFDVHPPVVLMKGAQDPAFFISWHSQRDVIQSLSWKSAAMIWAGPALTLLSIYLLALQYGWL